MKPLYKRAKFDTALAPQSLASTSATGAYFDLSQYRKALIVVHAGAVAAGKAVTVALQQATDATGTDAKAIEGASATVTATDAMTSAKLLIEVEIHDLDINNGFDFLAAEVSTTDAISVGATLIRGDGRFEDLNEDADALVEA